MLMRLVAKFVKKGIMTHGGIGISLFHIEVVIGPAGSRAMG